MVTFPGACPRKLSAGLLPALSRALHPESFSVRPWRMSGMNFIMKILGRAPQPTLWEKALKTATPVAVEGAAIAGRAVVAVVATGAAVALAPKVTSAAKAVANSTAKAVKTGAGAAYRAATSVLPKKGSASATQVAETVDVEISGVENEA